MRHERCGHIWNATPSHFLQGKGYPKCTGCMKKNDKRIQTRNT